MLALRNLVLPRRPAIATLNIDAGANIGIIGPSDSGKSAILLAMMGQESMAVRFERETDLQNCDFGFVPSKPSLLFSGIKDTVGGEMALSLQFIGRRSSDVGCIADRFGITNLMERDPFSLSGGEMTLAALAMVAVKRPKIWLLDQVYESLHPDMRERCCTIMREELARGCAVVETHSVSPGWADKYNQVIFLDGRHEVRVGEYLRVARSLHDTGLLSEVSQLSFGIQRDRGIPIVDHHNIDHLISAVRPYVIQSQHVLSEPVKACANPVLSLSKLSFRYGSSGFSVGPLTSCFQQGEVVAILGANGAGKSTLLKMIALLNAPKVGRVCINGRKPNWHRWKWPRSALYCFQNPDDQLYCPSVRSEVEKTITCLGRTPPKDILEQYRRLGLLPYLDKEPYHLARPIRRMVCLSPGFIAPSPVLLFDEPTADLDATQRRVVLGEIGRLSRSGFVVLVVSHDYAFVAEACSRSLVLEGGGIAYDGPLLPWKPRYVPPVIAVATALGLSVARYSDLLAHISNKRTTG
jgi:energy-coupling factor transporter ATP-binding protein EcfA2